VQVAGDGCMYLLTRRGLLGGLRGRLSAGWLSPQDGSSFDGQGRSQAGSPADVVSPACSAAVSVI